MARKEFNGEFKELTTKFLFLNYNKDTDSNEKYYDEISSLLNDLNSLDYDNNNVIDTKASLRLLDSLKNIHPNQDTLIMKSCYLISTLISRQKILLPEKQFDSTVNWLVRCLESPESKAKSDVLSVLSILFKMHPYSYKYFQQLLLPDSTVIGHLNSKKTSKLQSRCNDESYGDIFANTLSLIDSLLSSVSDENIQLTSSDYEIFAMIGSKIISFFYAGNVFNNSSLQCINSTLHSLNILDKISQEDSDWCEENIGELFGISKFFIHFGLINSKPPTNIQKILPSQQSIIDLPFQVNTNVVSKGGKIPKTRKPRTIAKTKKREHKITKEKQYNDSLCGNFKTPLSNEVINYFKTSESDFSETETGRINSERHRQAKIRLSAISLINTIIKNVDKRKICGYWHCILPFENIDFDCNILSISSTYNLFTSAVKDPNVKCRITALQAISLLLYESKHFFMMAENLGKNPSFTPFSMTLGNTIISMFNILNFAIRTESSLPILTHFLKCLAVLIQVTPFTRLKPGFVTQCIEQTKPLVYHKDPTIQVAALMVMEFLISTPEITAEISECVGLPKSNTKIIKSENKLSDISAEEIIQMEYYEDENLDEMELSEFIAERNSEKRSQENISWLLKKVVTSLIKNPVRTLKKSNLISTPIPVRIECLQVLTALSSHILFLKDHLDLVCSGLIYSLQDEQHEIRLHAAKCLDTLGYSINTFLLTNSTQSDITNCLNFWMKILPPTIEKIQEIDQSSALKSTLCDFLSNVGVHIFERCPHSQQMLLISMLTGISYNEDNIVRASAGRALAVYVLFPSLKEDICFVENTAAAIVELLKEKNGFVRVKASWSLGNISDALIPLSTESKLDRISDELLLKMFEISIELMNDNDKVKCNAVRTLGNLLRLIRVEQIEISKWRHMCFQVIQKLATCLTKVINAKVKWNTCYAIGNFMKNDLLFTAYDDFMWQRIVFDSLSYASINSSNFKVRINSVNALTTIKERQRYGIFFLEIWKTLLISLEQSDNLVDFSEYKHRDNLQQQLCFALCHMIKLANREDFCQMNQSFSNREFIKQTWNRVINRAIPENASLLMSCSSFLQNYLENKRTELNLEQKNSILMLKDCFISSNGTF